MTSNKLIIALLASCVILGFFSGVKAENDVFLNGEDDGETHSIIIDSNFFFFVKLEMK